MTINVTNQGKALSESELSFSQANFIRRTMSVTWERTGIQPSDFTTTEYLSPSGKTYAQEYAADPTGFLSSFPDWNDFADYFIKKRAVVVITGSQEVSTKRTGGAIMDIFCTADAIDLQPFRICGGVQDIVSSIPYADGYWYNNGAEVTDLQNGYTRITATYIQYREWTIVKHKDGTPPNPAGS